MRARELDEGLWDGVKNYLGNVRDSVLTDVGTGDAKRDARARLMVAAATRHMLDNWRDQVNFNEVAATPENLIQFVVDTYNTNGADHAPRVRAIAQRAAERSGILGKTKVEPTPGASSTKSDAEKTAEPPAGGKADAPSGPAEVKVPTNPTYANQVRNRLRAAQKDGANRRTLAALVALERMAQQMRPNNVADMNAVTQKFDRMLSQALATGKQSEIAREYLLNTFDLVKQGKIGRQTVNLGGDESSTRRRLFGARNAGIPETSRLYKAMGSFERAIKKLPRGDAANDVLSREWRKLEAIAAEEGKATGNAEAFENGMNVYLKDVNAALTQNMRKWQVSESTDLHEAERKVSRREIEQFFAVVARMLIGAGYIRVTGLDDKMDQQMAARGGEAPMPPRPARARDEDRSDEPPVVAKVDLRAAADLASRELGKPVSEIEQIMRNVHDDVARNPAVNWRTALSRLKSEDEKRVAEFLFAYMIGNVRDIPR